ncbi:hypothetical protein BpHYR1_031037 [Brachionus plicatilis]|uniref:Uncharacterized protein n=1 Tax=Brachionus plicatilis TaxID=10195 RepID=A0A3M7PZF3_BRAPC|nr:hypothetical protein BpHYR1_031037 [Brachionus plicatilis]
MVTTFRLCYFHCSSLIYFSIFAQLTTIDCIRTTLVKINNQEFGSNYFIVYLKKLESCLDQLTFI